MAHGTTEPTEKYREATATPISPVCGSMATMEKVETGGKDCATAVQAQTNNKIEMTTGKHFLFMKRSSVRCTVAE